MFPTPRLQEVKIYDDLNGEYDDYPVDECGTAFSDPHLYWLKVVCNDHRDSVHLSILSLHIHATGRKTSDLSPFLSRALGQFHGSFKMYNARKNRKRG